MVQWDEVSSVKLSEPPFPSLLSLQLFIRGTTLEIWPEVLFKSHHPDSPVAAALICCISKSGQNTRYRYYLLVPSVQNTSQLTVLPHYTFSTLDHGLVATKRYDLSHWPCDTGGQIQTCTGRSRPTFVAWLKSKGTDGLFVHNHRRGNSCIEWPDVKLEIENNSSSKRETWLKYPHRLGIACFADGRCLVQAFSHKSVAWEGDIPPVAHGMVASLFMSLLLLVTFILGVAIVFRHRMVLHKLRQFDLCKRMHTRIRRHASRHQAYGRCCEKPTVNTSGIVHLHQNIHGLPTTLHPGLFSTFDQHCSYAHRIQSRASYENLNRWCRHNDSSTDDGRYARSLPSLTARSDSDLTDRKHVHPTAWGRLVDGVWEINPSQIKVTHLLGRGGFGRVMQAKLLLPPEGTGTVCCVLQQHIGRVTDRSSDSTSQPFMWVAIKQIFHSESEHNTISDGCIGHLTTEVDHAQTLHSCCKNDACHYAELASCEQRSRTPLSSLRCTDHGMGKTSNYPLIGNRPSIAQPATTFGYNLSRKTTNQISLLKAELAVMKLAGIHPNVVRLIGQSDLLVFGPVLVIEYCPRGNLRSYLRSLRSNLTQNQIEMSPLQNQLLSYVSQVAEGMRYLSSRNMVLRSPPMGSLHTRRHSLPAFYFGTSAEHHSARLPNVKTTTLSSTHWYLDARNLANSPSRPTRFQSDCTETMPIRLSRLFCNSFSLNVI
ncbi:unnamed protein product [Dicrocoelium dendriticum]|nr:unnamed protein product [Dicrocoelium dendriticum]